MSCLYQLQIINNDYSKLLLRSQCESNNDITFDGNFDIKKFYSLFNNDIIEYSDSNIKLVKRNISTCIVGVLELFSKYSFPNNKRGIPGYIFRPIESQLPIFIVHSKIKKSKNKNQLVSVKFTKWEITDKFPKGEIISIFGDLDCLKSMENALLYFYDIYPKKMRYQNNIVLNNTDSRIKITDKIFSIDPKGCRDIDDAFSIKKQKDNDIHLKVHISDVYSVLKENNLLDFIQNKCSIYQTDNIIHMLDKMLSENYCSLIQKENRYMITLDLKMINNKIDYQIYKSFGKITKNYCYEDELAFIERYFPDVESIYNLVTQNKIRIKDSHKFIEALMIIYNTLFSEFLINSEKKVIFRAQSNFDYTIPKNIDESLHKFLKILQSDSAIYSITDNFHSSLNISNYSHSTSPIRRIVDLLNQELFHNGNILSNKYTIDSINKYEVLVKKYYRKTSILKLANSLYLNGEDTIEGYIYEIKDNYMSIYIPDKNISIQYKFTVSKHIDRYNINYNNSSVELNFNDITYNIPLNTKIVFTILGKPDILNINDSIKINMSDFICL